MEKNVFDSRKKHLEEKSIYFDKNKNIFAYVVSSDPLAFRINYPNGGYFFSKNFEHSRVRASKLEKVSQNKLDGLSLDPSFLSWFKNQNALQEHQKQECETLKHYKHGKSQKKQVALS